MMIVMILRPLIEGLVEGNSDSLEKHSQQFIIMHPRAQAVCRILFKASLVMLAIKVIQMSGNLLPQAQQ